MEVVNMKRFLILFISVALFSSALLVTNCSNSEDPANNDTNDMTDLVIADDFNFTAERDVEVTFRALYAGVFYIYDMEDNLLKKGRIDLYDGYQGTVSIPNDVDDVKLKFSEVEDLEAVYTITGDLIDYDFYPPSEEREVSGRCWDQIHPILECVDSLGAGMYLAHFGYRNDYGSIQQIPIGNDNRFGNTSNWNMGQRTVFQPGRWENEFTVEFSEEETCCIYWRLSGTLGEGVATARTSSTICPRGYGDDDDDDGVLNDDDDFPYDEDRAFLNYYPGDDSLSWGTLAFEDRWPLMGDYDFNDVIIRYRFETVDDPADNLLEVFGYFSLKASGASYEDGFAIEMPFPAGNVEILTVTPGDLAGLSIEDGDESKIIKFFSNALEIMSKPETSTFVNTDSSDPYLEPVDFELYLKLAVAVDESTLPWSLPYNPFIIIDQQAGYEVHLPDMPPTIFADPLLFGTEDDTSDPGTNRYYKTIINLPWAINIPVEWVYPIERIAIIDAYNYFDDWAESSGDVYNDWHENTEGYTVDANLYQIP